MGYGEPTQHDADHGETDESDDGTDVPFEVARQSLATADPCEGAFDDLAFRQHLEAWHVDALDDYRRQAPVFATVAAIFGP